MPLRWVLVPINEPYLYVQRASCYHRKKKEQNKKIAEEVKAFDEFE